MEGLDAHRDIAPPVSGFEPGAGIPVLQMQVLGMVNDSARPQRMISWSILTHGVTPTTLKVCPT